MNKLKASVSTAAATLSAYALPYVVSAQDQVFEGGSGFEGAITNIRSLLESLIPVISVLALIAFFIGLAMYIFNADDEEGRENGKKTMIAGIVALFLIAAIGGIISFLVESTVGENTQNEVKNPFDYQG